MNIEPNDGMEKGKTRPAGMNDQTKFVSAVFAVSDRDKDLDFSKKTKGKTKTIIIGSKERLTAPLVTELGEGMRIQAENGTRNHKDNSIGDR